MRENDGRSVERPLRSRLVVLAVRGRRSALPFSAARARSLHRGGLSGGTCSIDGVGGLGDGHLGPVHRAVCRRLANPLPLQDARRPDLRGRDAREHRDAPEHDRDRYPPGAARHVRSSSQ